MRCTNVLDRPHHAHPLVQRQGVACQRPAPACQGREAFPERRVQPLPVRRLDPPVPVRAASQRRHPCRRAIHNSAVGRAPPSPLVTLDDLGAEKRAPWAQWGSSALARLHGVAKGLANGSNIGHQAIGAAQQRTVRGTAPHALAQAPEQRQVALLTDFPAEPQPGLHHHGQGHPHDAALFFHAQLIGLHLSQVAWLLDKILVHGLALTARASPPRRDGALIKPTCRHNRLHGPPMGEQGHDEHHRVGRGAQPIENGAFAGAEGLLTRVTDEPLLLLRMDTNIALADLTSGRAVPVGAECRRGVYDAPPGCAWKTLPGEVCLDPRLLYNCTAPRFGVELPFCASKPKYIQYLNLPKKYLKRLHMFNSAKWVMSKWHLDEQCHDDHF